MALTVLVVDDYPDARLLLSYVLEDAGFRVLYADTGPQAIEMARGNRPDAIVMDLNLPGMSGIEATRRIRADVTIAGVPIVAHTMSSKPLDAADLTLFDAFFSKPSPADSLVEVIQRAIQART